MTDWRHKLTLRPSEVARITSLSLRTIQAKIADGSLPSCLVGGCRLVSVRDVLRLVGEAPEGEAIAARSSVTRRADEILDHLRSRHG